MTASRLLPFSLVAFPLVFAACGGEGLTLPDEGEPARIEILEEGNNQSGRVNEVLPVTLKVRVTDSRGEPVPGSDVLFSFAGGTAAGVPTPESATTDSDGQASTTLALGNVAGTHKGTAQVQSAPAVNAEFTVIALPADANGIHIVSGDPQTATVNSTLSQPLVVVVTDANDNPIPNVPIQWTAEGGGTVSAVSNVTDGNGQASVTRTLGPTAGTQTTRADAGLIAGSPATFTHTATAGSANLIAKISGDGQEATPGSELALPLIVQVVDAAGNPIANEAVTWVTSNGTFANGNTTTDEQGFASTRWTIGPTPGINTATAVASRAGTSTVSFTATGTATPAPPPTQIQMHGGDGQEGPVNTTLAAPLSVKVTTAAGAPVSGQAVIWSAGGGGSVSAASSLTNSEGVAEVQRTLGSTPGAYATTATVSGLSGSPVTFTSTATAGGPSAVNSGVSASPSTIPVGGQSTITVVVRDGSNNLLPGVSVSVAASGTGNTITPASASTGANGVATFTFSSTVAETKTITATAGGVTLNDSPTITVQKTSSTVEITEDEPDPSTVGTAITVEFSVRGSGGTPTGEVIVTLSGGDETCRATLVDGNGSCSLTPTAAGPDANNNRRIITATYGGDARFSGDTDTENHRVNPAPPSNQAPTAAFTPPSCTVGVPCTFNDGSTDSDGTISDRFWTFEGAVPSTSGEQTPVVIFLSEGSKAVTLEVTDNERATDTETQQVTVTLPTPQNQAPTPVGDEYFTPGAGQGMMVDAPGVLSNDTDPDLDPLIARNASDPALGSVLLNENGSFTYTPDLGATGSDSFTYEAYDGALATTATVTVNITP